MKRGEIRLGVLKRTLFSLVLAAMILGVATAIGLTGRVYLLVVNAPKEMDRWNDAHGEARTGPGKEELDPYDGNRCVMSTRKDDLGDVRRQCGMGLDWCLKPLCQEGVVRIGEGGVPVPPGAKDYAFEKPPRTIRILALGGSTTAGIRAPTRMSSWPMALETELNRRALAENLDLRVEVLNGALAGYGSRQSDTWYGNVGRRFAGTDIIIFGEEVNDLPSCAAWWWEGAAGGRSIMEVVAEYIGDSGRTTIDDVRGLGPWWREHAPFFLRERDRIVGGKRVQAARDLILGDAEAGKGREKRWAACEQNARDPARDPLGAESIFDDFAMGWEFTRRNTLGTMKRARGDGTRIFLVSTTPHDFTHWNFPVPNPADCEGIEIALNDWYRYITRIHNPGLRKLSGEESGVRLVDLEMLVDGLDERAKKRLFPCEWMHADPLLGSEFYGKAYADAVWPLVAGFSIRATEP